MTFSIEIWQMAVYGGIGLAAVGFLGLIISSATFSKKRKRTLEKISQDL